MMTIKRPSNRKSLATLITGTVIWVIGVFTVGVLLQSYHLSSKIVQEEVLRTSKQTSSLVRNYFNYRLASLQILQDSNAQSDSVEQYFINRDDQTLDFFFLREDNQEPVHSPDFRFIFHLKDMLWNDGNALFYGIDELSLANIANKANANSQWSIIKTPSQLGLMHVLVRRTPVIDSESGEVLGFLFVGIVLSDNTGLLSSMALGSNSDDILLVIDKQIIGSTVTIDDKYSAESILNRDQTNIQDLNKILISHTDLSVGSDPKALTFLSVQQNPNVLTLRNNYLFWLGFTLLVISILSYITRRWLDNKVTSELSKLMLYTKVAGDKGTYTEFDGSNIQEFDHIGQTLSDTFTRLFEQEKQFQDLFNFSLSPLLVCSEDAALIKINPAARKALELEPYRLDSSDNSTFENFLLQIKPHVFMASKGATLTGINVPIGRRVYRWNLSSIDVKSGQTIVLVQGLDITTLVDAEKQSLLARQEAEESAKARADFLARMSHEIRTPLNGILGISQLLKRTSKDKSQQDKIDVLCNSGEHLLAVLNDILDFSKIENGNFDVELHTFKFEELVNALEGIYKPLCIEKGITLEVVNTLEDEATIYTDQVRVNQILFNLVSNAIKFTHHGTVRIHFELREGNSQHISQLVVAVRDTGIGISDDQKQRIFDPFVQSEATSIREYGGSGLGLAIVKHLVTILKGKIFLESEVGKGTTFTVNIPVERHASSLTQTLSEPEIDFSLFDNQVNVLLVEDNHTNAFIAKAFCEKYGMLVVWAKDGQEALELLKSQRFDLILMDNQLPSMSGIDVTRQICEDLGLSTPIYACTADNLESTRIAFIEAGAKYVIVKPIKEKTLNEALVHFKRNDYK